MWRLVSGLGALLTILGLLEVVLLWIPANFASTAWGFSAATGFLDAIPLLGLGLALLLAASVALGWRRRARTLAGACFLLALVVGLAAALYVWALPTSLGLTTDLAMRMQLTKLTVKAGVQALIYLTTFVVLAVISWRATRARVRR
jgi:hypothetical protein